MNRTRSLLLAALFFSTGCASTTVIRSHPSGATVRDTNGNAVGKTPYSHSDTRSNNHAEHFELELEGYETRSVTIRRDQMNPSKAIGFGVGGIFFPPVWVGLLWANDYREGYTATLTEDDKRKKVARNR